MTATSPVQQQQEALKQQGTAAFTAGRFDEAIELYRRAVALDPESEVCAAIHSNISASIMSIGDPAAFGEALEHAERAVALRPDWHKAHYRAAVALLETHRFAESLAACERVLELEPGATELIAKCLGHSRKAVHGCAVLPPAIDAAIADPARLLASTWCIIAGGEDPARLHQLFKLDQAGELDRLRDGLLAHLAQLKERVASLPIEVLHAATRDAARTVDGICALALYTSDYPRGKVKLARSFDTALRIVEGGSGESDLFSRRNAELIRDSTAPFRAALEWMVRTVVMRPRRVDFRSVGFALYQPRIGSKHKQECFNAMTDPRGVVGHLTRDTVMVLITQSSAAVGFASMVPAGQQGGGGEVLLPPGVELEVMAVASATLLNVLHFGAGKKLVTLREVGMRPTANELFKAARAAAPAYEKFSRIYEIPSVAPRGAVGGAVVGAGGVVGAIGGEAGGGAAAGNNNNSNRNVVRLDAALDQNNSGGGDMLIIASGGTGKTAAAVFAQVHLSRQDAGRRLMPIFLPLARLKRDDVTRQGGLDAALAGALGCNTATLVEAARRFSVVAILDSLDETMVEDAHWAGLLERNPAAQQCRVIMTSRPTPLATEQHQRIFGSARRVQVLDLLPLPQQNVNRIFAQLVNNNRNAQLPAALLASGDATPLLASFAATLVNKRVDISGVTGQRALLELYLQHTCDLPQQALSDLCLRLLAGGFHCTLGEAKVAAGRVADVASRVPCRVEDEFDDASHFSLLHRSLVEHVIARDVAAGRLSFESGSDLSKVSPVALTGVTRMVLADAQCPFRVRLRVVSHLIIVDHDPSALELAQELLAEEERRAGEQPTDDLARLLDIIGFAFKNRGYLQRAQEFGERAVRMREALYEQAQDAELKQRRGRNLAAACNNLAITYRQQKNYAVAQRHYERAIELGERHGDDEVSVAQKRENLAIVFLQHGDPARALQEFERCLGIYERRLGGGHHQVALCLGNMGVAHLRLRQPERAVPLLPRALAIQSRELPAHHVEIARSHSRLGDAHRDLGNKPEARQHYEEAVRIFALNGQEQNAEICWRRLEMLDDIEEKREGRARK